MKWCLLLVAVAGCADPLSVEFGAGCEPGSYGWADEIASKSVCYFTDAQGNRGVRVILDYRRGVNQQEP